MIRKNILIIYCFFISFFLKSSDIIEKVKSELCNNNAPKELIEGLMHNIKNTYIAYDSDNKPLSFVKYSNSEEEIGREFLCHQIAYCIGLSDIVAQNAKLYGSNVFVSDYITFIPESKLKNKPFRSIVDSDGYLKFLEKNNSGNENKELSEQLLRISQLSTKFDKFSFEKVFILSFLSGHLDMHPDNVLLQLCDDVVKFFLIDFGLGLENFSLQGRIPCLFLSLYFEKFLRSVPSQEVRNLIKKIDENALEKLLNKYNDKITIQDKNDFFKRLKDLKENFNNTKEQFFGDIMVGLFHEIYSRYNDHFRDNPDMYYSPHVIKISDKIIFGDDVEVAAENPFLATNLFKVIKLNEKVINGNDGTNDYSIPGGDKENFSMCMNIFNNREQDVKDLNTIARLYAFYNSIPHTKKINETQYIFTENDKKLFDDFNKEKNDISKDLLDVLEKSPAQEIINLYKELFFPHGDNFLSSLLLFSLKNSGEYIQEYLISNAREIKDYTQSSTKQYLWQGSLQDNDVVIYDLFHGKERGLNYFFDGEKAKILEEHLINNLYDIINENSFVFFDSETQQLHFVYARKDRLGKYIIKEFSCTSLWDGKDRVKKNIHAPKHPLVIKAPVRAFVRYGSSYYYVNYEDKNYILFYDQEKDGFVFVPVPKKRIFTDQNGYAGGSHIWTMVNNGVYITGNLSLVETLLIDWSKNTLYFSDFEPSIKEEDKLTINNINQKENLYFLEVEDNRYGMLSVDGGSNKYTYKLSEFLSIVYGNWWDPLNSRGGKNLTFNLRWCDTKKTKKAVSKPLLNFSTLNTRKNTKDQEQSHYLFFNQGNYKENYLSRLYDVGQILTYVIEHYDDTKIFENISDNSDDNEESSGSDTKKVKKKQKKRFYVPITVVALILFYMGIKLKPYFSKTNHG